MRGGRPAAGPPRCARPTAGFTRRRARPGRRRRSGSAWPLKRGSWPSGGERWRGRWPQRVPSCGRWRPRGRCARPRSCEPAGSGRTTSGTTRRRRSRTAGKRSGERPRRAARTRAPRPRPGRPRRSGRGRTARRRPRQGRPASRRRTPPPSSRWPRPPRRPKRRPERRSSGAGGVRPSCGTSPSGGIAPGRATNGPRTGVPGPMPAGSRRRRGRRRRAGTPSGRPASWKGPSRPGAGISGSWRSTRRASPLSGRRPLLRLRRLRRSSPVWRSRRPTSVCGRSATPRGRPTGSPGSGARRPRSEREWRPPATWGRKRRAPGRRRTVLPVRGRRSISSATSPSVWRRRSGRAWKPRSKPPVSSTPG
jgi:hypothetical protein